MLKLSLCQSKQKYCLWCHLEKQNKLPYSSSTAITYRPFEFELVQMDIWGPLSIPSLHGHKYFLTIVDDFTRHTWLFLVKLKSETRTIMENFIILVKNQFDTVIKTIWSDNGTDFVFPDLYNKHGIIHHTSCVATPQQNSDVERKHLHILNVTRSLLFQSHLPKIFWSYAVKHAVHIINRLP